MRFILKVLFAPVIAVLAVFIWLCSIAIRISGMALSIVSGLFAVAGIIYIITESVGKGCIGLIIAFLLCPYGLPMLAVLLLGSLQQFRYAIQDRIYG
jgi:hypothetical protein